MIRLQFGDFVVIQYGDRGKKGAVWGGHDEETVGKAAPLCVESLKGVLLVGDIMVHARGWEMVQPSLFVAFFFTRQPQCCRIHEKGRPTAEQPRSACRIRQNKHSFGQVYPQALRKLSYSARDEGEGT